MKKISKLEKLRLDKGYTQEELAKKADISLEELIRYETDITYVANASAYTAVRIAQALDCIVEDLYTMQDFENVKRDIDF